MGGWVTLTVLDSLHVRGGWWSVEEGEAVQGGGEVLGCEGREEGGGGGEEEGRDGFSGPAAAVGELALGGWVGGWVGGLSELLLCVGGRWMGGGSVLLWTMGWVGGWVGGCASISFRWVGGYLGRRWLKRGPGCPYRVRAHRLVA